MLLKHDKLLDVIAKSEQESNSVVDVTECLLCPYNIFSILKICKFCMQFVKLEVFNLQFSY